MAQLQIQDAPPCPFRDPLPPTTYFGKWTTVGKCRKTLNLVTAEYCKMCAKLPDVCNGNLNAWLTTKLTPNSDEDGTSPRRGVLPGEQGKEPEVKQTMQKEKVE